MEYRTYRLFPPIPWGKGLDSHKASLTKRFAEANSTAIERARNVKKDVNEKIEQIRQKISQSPEGAERKELTGSLDELKDIAKLASESAEKYASLGPDREDAADYVNRGLDLQVAKATGLLAFNAVTIAVVVLLWSTRTIPSPQGLFSYVLATAVLLSNLLTLIALWSSWGPPECYESATKDIDSALKVAAYRSWGLNVGVTSTLLCVALIAWWVVNGEEKNVNVAIQGTAPIPVRFVAGNSGPNIFSLDCKPREQAAKDQKSKKDQKGPPAPAIWECIANAK